MIRVHHLNASRSHRVLWLLEELELPYEIVRYQRQPNMLAPPELRAIHPLGKAPVVEDDGRVFAESGAILEGILERHGRGRLEPERGSDAWYRYRYWMHYAEGSAMPPMLLGLVLRKMGPFGWPARGFVKKQIDLHCDFMESELAKATWFAGDELSAADVQMSFPVEAAIARGGDRPRPRLRAFLERVHARPAYQRAVAKGGELKLVG